MESLRWYDDNMSGGALILRVDLDYGSTVHRAASPRVRVEICNAHNADNGNWYWGYASYCVPDHTRVLYPLEMAVFHTGRSVTKCYEETLAHWCRPPWYQGPTEWMQPNLTVITTRHRDKLIQLSLGNAVVLQHLCQALGMIVHHAHTTDDPSLKPFGHSVAHRLSGAIHVGQRELQALSSGFPARH